MLREKLMRYILYGVFFILSGCVGMPEGIQPVSNFDLNRYLGEWQEIARLDHSFERGLSKVTADYSLREDGGINVVNRGFSAENNVWKEASGKAYFVNEENEGYLKVSFYLWLLSKKPAIETEVIERFVAISKSFGFDTSKLIFVTQQ